MRVDRLLPKQNRERTRDHHSERHLAPSSSILSASTPKIPATNSCCLPWFLRLLARLEKAGDLGGHRVRKSSLFAGHNGKTLKAIRNQQNKKCRSPENKYKHWMRCVPRYIQRKPLRNSKMYMNLVVDLSRCARARKHWRAGAHTEKTVSHYNTLE